MEEKLEALRKSFDETENLLKEAEKLVQELVACLEEERYRAYNEGYRDAEYEYRTLQ